jgi:D-alanyl-D-alanine carboxypeptidase
MSLGYRTLYVWFEKENLMITLQTNSQPAGDADKLSVLLETIHQIVESQAK